MFIDRRQTLPTKAPAGRHVCVIREKNTAEARRTRSVRSGGSKEARKRENKKKLLAVD